MAKGCGACGDTGYRGRVGIFELMEMTNQIREMAFNREPTQAIRAQARRSGMVTLEEDGIRKLFAGVTTIEEVMEVTQREQVLT